MKDLWRIVPPIDNPNATTRDVRFQGLTELKRGHRTWAMCGVGPDIEAALLKHAEGQS